MEFLRCENVIRIYKPQDRKTTHITALGGISFKVDRRATFGIMGPSGSGKTTLLRLIAGLDRVSSGHIVIAGLDIAWADPQTILAWRSQHLGYIYQNPTQNVIPELTVLQNLKLAISLRRIKYSSLKAEQDRITALFDFANLTKVSHRLVKTLSGGETQRLAVILACLGEPDLILADEPTGELDWDSAKRVIQLIRQISEEYDTTSVISTHDHRLLQYFDRTLEIWGGKPVRLLRHSIEIRNYEETTSALIPITDTGELRLPPKMVKILGNPSEVLVEVQDDHIQIRRIQEKSSKKETQTV